MDTCTSDFSAVAGQSVLTFSPTGKHVWRNAEGKKHKADGPAVVYPKGSEWWLNGNRHRLDGPAVDLQDGTKECWVDGCYHRLDGPAIERKGGARVWYKNGKKHRLDGPAAEYAGGIREYWIESMKLSEEQFMKQTEDFRREKKEAERRALLKTCDAFLTEFRRVYKTGKNAL